MSYIKKDDQSPANALDYLRYIFSTEILDHIKSVDAVEDLCLTLLAYLGSGALDMELDDEELTNNILSGKYRLLEYAVINWPNLIPQINPKSSGYVKLLERMIDKGRNFEFEGHQTTRHYRNEHLRNSRPDAYDMVCRTFQLHLDNDRGEWNWENSTFFICLSLINCSRIDSQQLLRRHLGELRSS